MDAGEGHGTFGGEHVGTMGHLRVEQQQVVREHERAAAGRRRQRGALRRQPGRTPDARLPPAAHVQRQRRQGAGVAALGV